MRNVANVRNVRNVEMPARLHRRVANVKMGEYENGKDKIIGLIEYINF